MNDASDKPAVYDGPAYAPGGAVVFVFDGSDGEADALMQPARSAFPEARVIAMRGAAEREPGTIDDLDRQADRLRHVIDAHRDPAPRATIGIGYTDGADLLSALLDRDPDRFTHAVLMHPRMVREMDGRPPFPGLGVLITAGGRDPQLAPEKAGDLAEGLEARGADVRMWWHHGGHELTAAEWDAVASWLADVRAGFERPDTLDIFHEEAGGKGRWFVRAASGHEAEMTYSRVSADRIIVDHTGVPDVFRGKGVGQRLYRAMVETSRREGWTVIPLCPFAAAQFRRHPEDTDVLAREYRTD